MKYRKYTVSVQCFYRLNQSYSGSISNRDKMTSHPNNLSFDDVIIVLDDGNEMPMQRCKKCDYVIGNNFHSKHTHS